MIKNLKLNNFTVFTDLAIEFSPKINVIIGENGMGKTHLLKAAYALCSGARSLNSKFEVSEEDISDVITKLLLRLYLPLKEKLSPLRRYDGTVGYAAMSANFVLDKNIHVNFHTNSKSVAIIKNTFYERYSYNPVFIPTKEVLSFMKGFSNLFDKYELSFDQTYQDICLLLDGPSLREESLPEKSKWAIGEIENICGGRFIFNGGGNVTFKTVKQEYSANAMAEGFRKAGMLSRLLETGALQPGISGPLFWDEPESNLNPKLMNRLVQILLELSRNGQQIILATHDYALLKWFDLLMDKGKDDHVRFHTLYQDLQSGQVKIDSTDDYREIEKNPIAEAFNHLTIAHAKLRLKGVANGGI